MDFMQNTNPRDIIEKLILPSRTITEAIANRLWLEVDSVEKEDLVDLFLWKFGFHRPRFQSEQARLRSRLTQFLETLLATKTQISEEDRERIRGIGVNVFVSLERFAEEFLAYNVWLLSSDHFVGTHFCYSFSAAVKTVDEVLGATVTIGGRQFAWVSGGGNTLGTIMIYLRHFIRWMKSLSTKDKTEFRRLEEELPYYAKSDILKFPFRHTQLWADSSQDELSKYIAQFEKITEQLELSSAPEIRNGLDHYRDKRKFPRVDTMISSQARLEQALTLADQHRLIPKLFWLESKKSDNYGRDDYTLVDYKDIRLTLQRPSLLSGMPAIKFNSPIMVPFGNIIGETSSELTFNVQESSSYTNYWACYPTLRSRPTNASTNSEAHGIPEDELAAVEMDEPQQT